MPSDGSARMMPTEEPTLPPGVVIRQVQVEDGSRFTEVRKGTQTYRVNGSQVPNVTLDNTGRVLISGRPGTYESQGRIIKVLKGPNEKPPQPLQPPPQPPPTSMSIWQVAGASLSLKNAIAEYGVTEQMLKEAKIPCSWRSHFGNSFPIFIRSDVERVAKEKLGSEYEVKQARKALRNVNTQLASLQAQAATLEAQKATLEAQLAGLGASPEEPPKPRTAAKKGGRSKQPAAKRARKSAGGDSDDDWRP